MKGCVPLQAENPKIPQPCTRLILVHIFYCVMVYFQFFMVCFATKNRNPSMISILTLEMMHNLILVLLSFKQSNNIDR